MRLTSTPNHDDRGGDRSGDRSGDRRDERKGDRKRRLDALPGDCTPPLHAIDERLSALAKQSAVPSGLSQRIFAASVEKLPSQIEVNRSLRFVDRLWGGRIAWGQFAMAASVALAFGIAFWFVQGPHTRRAENIAHRTADPDVSLASMLRQLPSGQSHLENDFDYLLETSELTSPDEITSELVMLVRELEM